MSYYWLTDPELFLYAKGTGPDDVLLRRCKKMVSSSSSLVVPMKPDDFDFVKIVKNHLELIGYMFDWDELDYKRLVEYIYEKRILVNGQGFVIAELHKAEKDGNKTIDDADEEVPAIYIRSLDVLPLKPYIPKLREQPIPLRTVKYLGDVDGKAAVMEKDFNVTKLTARVDHLEAENIRLESKNNTLDTNVTKLTADMVTQMNALATLRRELDRKLENPNIKEVWMNDLTNSEWVGLEALQSDPNMYDSIIVIKPPGTFTRDENSTNVQARYWCKLQTTKSDGSTVFTGVRLEDLTPRKDKARFLLDKWLWYIEHQGKIYVLQKLIRNW